MPHRICIAKYPQKPPSVGKANFSANWSANGMNGMLRTTELVEMATPRSESHSQSNTRHRKAVMTMATIMLQRTLNIAERRPAPANANKLPIIMKPMPMISASLWLSGFSRRYWNF